MHNHRKAGGTEMWFILPLIAATLFLSSDSAFAQKIPDGAVIVRAEDGGASRCINGSSDVISFHLIGMTTEKPSARELSWLKEEAAVGLIIDTALEGATGGSVKKVAFPRAFMINVQQYKPGLLRLPVEQKLLSRFALTNGDNVYSTAEFSFRIVETNKDSPTLAVIKELANITVDLPLQANPFQDGFEYFARYGSRLIETLYGSSNSGDQTYDGKITFEFSPSADCQAGFESTGPKIVIKGHSGKVEDGFVDVKNTNKFCWRIRPSPSFGAEFADRLPDGTCPSENPNWSSLNNPHYAFLLNAYTRAAFDTTTTTIYSTSDFTPKRETSFNNWWDDGVYATITPQDVTSAANIAGMFGPPSSTLSGSTAPKLASVLVNDPYALSLDKKFGNAEVFALEQFAANSGLPANWIAPMLDTTSKNWRVLTGLQTDQAGLDIALALRRCETFNLGLTNCL
jgi:hypothetical protein